MGVEGEKYFVKTGKHLKYGRKIFQQALRQTHMF
jgi:hypothetical protein